MKFTCSQNYFAFLISLGDTKHVERVDLTLRTTGVCITIYLHIKFRAEQLYSVGETLKSSN